jgi:hypothetical protein
MLPLTRQSHVRHEGIYTMSMSMKSVILNASILIMILLSTTRTICFTEQELREKACKTYDFSKVDDKKKHADIIARCIKPGLNALGTGFTIVGLASVFLYISGSNENHTLIPHKLLFGICTVCAVAYVSVGTFLALEYIGLKRLMKETHTQEEQQWVTHSVQKIIKDEICHTPCKPSNASLDSSDQLYIKYFEAGEIKEVAWSKLVHTTDGFKDVIAGKYNNTSCILFVKPERWYSMQHVLRNFP